MESRVAGLVQIITHTPWWVWLLLAGLLIGGALRLKSRPVPVATLFIAPLVYLVWGLASLGIRISGHPSLLLPWLGAASLGAALGWLAAPVVLRADRENRRIHIPGSASTLGVGLTVFALKYTCNVAAVLRPDDRVLITMLDMAISGASAGYFWSGLGRMLLRYRSATQDATIAAPRVEARPGALTASA